MAVVLLLVFGRTLALTRAAADAVDRAATLAQLEAAGGDAVVARIVEARRLFPNDLALQRRLARAHMLRGETAAAIALLEAAAAQHPNSLLVRRDLAVLYTVQGETERAGSLWASLNYNLDMIVAYGDALLAEGQFAEAQLWYQAAARLAPNPDELRLRVFLAAQRSATPGGAQVAAALLATDPAFPILSPSMPVSVAGADLRLVTGSTLFPISFGETLRGERLRLGADDPAGIGVLWRNSEALVVVRVERAGSYTLQVRGRVVGPAPAELRLLVDGQLVHAAAFVEPTFTTVEVPMTLQPGVHTASVQFINEYFVQGGIDRRIELESLVVVPS